MGKPRKVEIFPGDEIGFVTILSEEEKAKSGHRRYRVRCRCGKEYTVLRPTLLHGIPKCVECRRKYSVKSDKGNVCGQRINNWEVLEEVEKNAYGTRKFKCRCTSCGSISVKSKGQMPDFMKGLAEGIEKSRSMVEKAISHVSSDLVLNPEMGNLKSGVFGGGSGGDGSVTVNVPLFLDGKQITSATSTIQSQRNVSYRRSLGVV